MSGPHVASLVWRCDFCGKHPDDCGASMPEVAQGVLSFDMALHEALNDAESAAHDLHIGGRDRSLAADVRAAYVTLHSENERLKAAALGKEKP